mmetsp:Transcript_9651/g.14867  ORF Transcript_9651/g.14867 Transcript_9651/m.14867 type:complete len:87 (-) Transcript_9651:111-371(-)
MARAEGGCRGCELELGVASSAAATKLSAITLLCSRTAPPHFGVKGVCHSGSWRYKSRGFQAFPPTHTRLIPYVPNQPQHRRAVGMG